MAVWSIEFVTAYSIGVATPTKPVTGVKVTAPVVVFTTYVPSFGIVSVVPKHDAAAVPVIQSLTLAALSVVPEAVESFVKGEMV
ncbi:unannotated protein [freshwater metagenome]|uniref:Unannotated protein n=1 Tax=freshwater metagenome TaxID=449393 RepID=A0A6J7QQU6_9ZZZZ